MFTPSVPADHRIAALLLSTMVLNEGFNETPTWEQTAFPRSIKRTENSGHIYWKYRSEQGV